MTLVVDPWHWLDESGSLPIDNRPLRRQALRVARLIEYGATLPAGASRETLVECGRRPHGVPCPCFLWVLKNEHDELVAFCARCGGDQMVIRNWQETDWADGMMEPVTPETVEQSLEAEVERRRRLN